MMESHLWGHRLQVLKPERTERHNAAQKNGDAWRVTSKMPLYIAQCRNKKLAVPRAFGVNAPAGGYISEHQRIITAAVKPKKDSMINPPVTHSGLQAMERLWNLQQQRIILQE